MNNKYMLWLSFIVCVTFIALPWFFIQGQYLVNGNISWLLMAAERLLDGQSLSQHIYETNPPLSILIYVPHVLFSKALSLPITVGSFYLTSIFVVISTLAVSLIIKSFTFLSDSEKKSFTLGYLVSVTLATTLFFSEREHIIMLALIPFVLCQYALTNNIKISKKLLIPVIIIGAIAVLIKPHYGIIPAVFLVGRMIRQKRINIFFDIDFVVLSTATLIYIGIIFTFFYDYIEVILPDVISLYASDKQPDIAVKSIQIYIVAIISFFILDVFNNHLSKHKKSLIFYLYSAAFLSFIPYFFQMKGFYNHIIPIYAFFICAITLSITFTVSKHLKNYKILHFTAPLAIILLISSSLGSLNNDYPKQIDIPKLPVGKFLEKECKKPCSFFVMHSDMEIFNPTAAYMGYTYASRFPTLWFIPKIPSRSNSANLKDKYAQMIVEDIKHYKPSIMLIPKNMPVKGVKDFNFIKFFGNSEELKNIFANSYALDGVFEFDIAEYFTGTTLSGSRIMTYYIYRRKI